MYRVDTGKRSCRLFDLETFTEDPNGIMGPHAVLPKHLVQFLKWSQNACPLLGSLKKLGTRRWKRHHLHPLRSSREAGRWDACLQRCRKRTVKYQSSSQEREASLGKWHWQLSFMGWIGIIRLKWWGMFSSQGEASAEQGDVSVRGRLWAARIHSSSDSGKWARSVCSRAPGEGDGRI